VIAVSALAKRYGAVHALRGVDLEARPGTVTGIAGPNGSGKTTLLKAVLGLVRPDGGEVRFDGRRIDGGWRYRARIGYMPQSARFPAHLTGDELLRMLTELRGAAEPPDRGPIEALGLAAELGKPLGTLSRGTLQKMSAAVALLFRPDALVLDEPVAGLDPRAAGVLRDHVRDARRRGAAVLLSSHVMSELEELADRIVYLVDGRIRVDGTVAEVRAAAGQPNLERALAALLTGGAGACPPAARPAGEAGARV
jgi:Cu-processing system ATP-binding protein